MLLIARRLLAAVTALMIIGGGLSTCLGWQANAGGRMACCQEDGTCPDTVYAVRVTPAAPAADQQEADRCCAAGEQHRSSETGVLMTVAPPLTADWLPVTPPHPVPISDTATSTRPPGSRLHLRLSVLLV